MSIANTINTGIVSVKLMINGTDKSSSLSVKSMVINHEVNRIPYASIVLVDGDVSRGSFDVSSSEDFVPGSEIELLAGYANDVETIFKGKVIRHSIKIRDVHRLSLRRKH